MFSSARIYVCASSNEACDVLTERLMKYIPEDGMIRIYGESQSCSKLPLEFENFTNCDRVKKHIFLPDREEYVNRRVVIMTPIVAGRIFIRGVKYDYLFIDEAGHTVETDLLIPIVQFFLRNSEGHLILGGDPLQLGPVVRTSIASALGYKMSYMERLMKTCPLYGKNNKKYNTKVITKLLHNYRSHEAILHTSNVLFYENELMAIKIRERLFKKDFPKDISVHSVEEFQGQERKVILLSTVRSQRRYLPSDYKYGLGFLKNEKRLNVSLTRATSLLIVIGNSDILQCDPNWKFFIDYCVENNSFIEDKSCKITLDNGL